MLKAFLLDKDMTDLEVEAKYVEMASEKSKVNWEELPLDELEKIYSTDEQRKWLQEKVVACSNLNLFQFYGFVFSVSEDWYINCICKHTTTQV